MRSKRTWRGKRKWWGRESGGVRENGEIREDNKSKMKSKEVHCYILRNVILETVAITADLYHHFKLTSNEQSGSVLTIQAETGIN